MIPLFGGKNTTSKSDQIAPGSQKWRKNGLQAGPISGSREPKMSIFQVCEVTSRIDSKIDDHSIKIRNSIREKHEIVLKYWFRRSSRRWSRWILRRLTGYSNPHNQN